MEAMDISWLWQLYDGSWDEGNRTFYAIAKATKILPNGFCLIHRDTYGEIWITRIVRPIQLEDLIRATPQFTHAWKEVSEKNNILELDVVSLQLIRYCRSYDPFRSVLIRSTQHLFTISEMDDGLGICVMNGMKLAVMMATAMKNWIRRSTIQTSTTNSRKHVKFHLSIQVTDMLTATSRAGTPTKFGKFVSQTAFGAKGNLRKRKTCEPKR